MVFAKIVAKLAGLVKKKRMLQTNKIRNKRRNNRYHKNTMGTGKRILQKAICQQTDNLKKWMKDKYR